MKKVLRIFLAFIILTAVSCDSDYFNDDIKDDDKQEEENQFPLTSLDGVWRQESGYEVDPITSVPENVVYPYSYDNGSVSYQLSWYYEFKNGIVRYYCYIAGSSDEVQMPNGMQYNPVYDSNFVLSGSTLTLARDGYFYNHPLEYIDNVLYQYSSVDPSFYYTHRQADPLVLAGAFENPSL